MKAITPVKDYIYNHDGKTVFLPIKWNFVLLSKVQGTFFSYEQYGPLSLIQSKQSIFITFESYQTYLNYYESQRGEDGEPDTALLQTQFSNNLREAQQNCRFE